MILGNLESFTFYVYFCFLSNVSANRITFLVSLARLLYSYFFLFFYLFIFLEKKEKNKKHDELVQKLPGLARDFDYGVGDKGLNIGNGSLDGLGFLLFFLFFF